MDVGIERRRGVASEDEVRAQVEGALARLPSEEQQVLRRRFGLDDGKSWSLEEVAELLGVDTDRVRQVEAKALHRLRSPNHPRFNR